LTVLIFAAAVLYSSVGHAGASGYLAAMALFGIVPDVMKATALCLNILVSIIATYKFWRAGHFSWRLFWPFAATSIPLAFVGGWVTLPTTPYKIVVGLVLVYSAWRMAIFEPPKDGERAAAPRIDVCLLTGAVLGFLSGLVGVGGGIFLSPLLLLLGWASVRQTAAVSAAFILVNSIAGILGQLSKQPELPAALPVWAAAAVVGGFIGAHYGSRKLETVALRRLLAVVLVIAGAKLIFGV
jgi:uncharacterized membrane protein YfcA